MQILIATNNTPHSAKAFEFGLVLAKQAKADLTLVRVITKPAERQLARQHLQDQRRVAEAAGFETHCFLQIGQIAEQILHTAHEEEVDLILLGEGSPDTLRRRGVGSTNERVIANATRPVLLVKGDSLSARRFLLLHSGQQGLPTIRRFLRYSGDLIRRKSEVTLLHVMSQIGASYRISDWQLRAEAEEMIKQKTLEGEWLSNALAAIKKARKVKAIPKVRHGLVVDEILDEAKKGDYDIVVLGNHRRGGWQEILVDNISKQVIAGLSQSVLIVHGGLEPPESPEN